MLKVFGRNDMFSKAKVLFEEVKVTKSDIYAISESDSNSVVLVPDAYTYNLMLEASASAHQWEYFEHVYREMIFLGYHLDQNKHLPLLVKASRAGKLHLLEHAFDTILEAGEIPHQVYFFELVIQAITQHNYERAVTLVSTMAYAPYRVTEKQWTDLFIKESKDRISHENLEGLLDALGSCDVVSEPTVSNLSRSLHVLCGLSTSRTISNIIPFGSENTVNGLNGGINDGGNGNVPNISEDLEDEVVSDTFTLNHDQVDRVNNNDVMVCKPLNCDIEDRISLPTDELEVSDDVALDRSSDSSDEEHWDDESCEDDDFSEGVIEKPSAYEILDAWKEMRKEDKSLSHSELSCG